jgi:DNA mismatch endonuclease, patch repair protein
MADMHNGLRSYTMSRIRSKDTQPEVIVRKALFASGFRFRIHVRGLIGKPDIVLPKYKTIIFVNGCFWHAHEGCKYNKMPKSRQEYWVPKIMKTVERDKRHKTELEKLGWETLTIWECELEKPKQDETLKNITALLLCQ